MFAHGVTNEEATEVYDGGGGDALTKLGLFGQRADDLRIYYFDTVDFILAKQRQVPAVRRISQSRRVIHGRAMECVSVTAKAGARDGGCVTVRVTVRTYLFCEARESW